MSFNLGKNRTHSKQKNLFITKYNDSCLFGHAVAFKIIKCNILHNISLCNKSIWNSTVSVKTSSFNVVFTWVALISLHVSFSLSQTRYFS